MTKNGPERAVTEFVRRLTSEFPTRSRLHVGTPDFFSLFGPPLRHADSTDQLPYPHGGKLRGETADGYSLSS
jgi:hypothetical protein